MYYLGAGVYMLVHDDEWRFQHGTYNKIRHYPESVTDASSECDILMQFTGLKDKNGKDIYEGDILKVSELMTNLRNPLLLDGEEWTGKVEYDAEGADYQITGSKLGIEGVRGFTSNQIREVIGNIYQSPNLLTESK